MNTDYLKQSIKENELERKKIQKKTPCKRQNTQHCSSVYH